MFDVYLIDPSGKESKNKWITTIEGKEKEILANNNVIYIIQ